MTGFERRCRWSAEERARFAAILTKNFYLLRDGSQRSVMVTKVYHAHIPKTAGTSLNSWLDDSVSYERAKPNQFDGELVRWFKARGIPGARSARVVSASCWDLYDVIHGHRNLLQARTPDSVVLTVLRDPVARSISLFFDLASLSEADFAHLQGPTLAYRRDCLTMPFAELRKKWSDSQLFLGQHVDYMCRFFLRNDVTKETFTKMTSKERFQKALASIERDVTAFGVTEQMSKSIHHFSEVLGLFPLKSLPRYNLGRPKTSEITGDDRCYLQSITAGDRMLWEHCAKKFEEIRVDYSVATFESVRLGKAIRAIALKRRGENLIYDMNAPLIGEGFWGRDRPGEPECCRWSGPSHDSVLYLPCPWNAPVEVALNVAEWIHRNARSSFHAKVWGEPAAHAFSAGPRLADVVRFRASPLNGVLKLEFHSAAKTDEERGSSASDGRRKGFLLSGIALLPG